MIKKLGSAVFSNADIVFDDLESDLYTSFNNDIPMILNLDDNNFHDDDDDDDYPESIIILDLWLCIRDLNKSKHVKSK